ncbi:MAG: hypothetical protein A2V65_01495 [Deltaproteobacteria bacterium RBG_13_49_15]|nr:MAG: hypothetical protein A2V65_01495 [Deltaproteobacteria bacterium RBG_13_49_15]
MKQKYLILKKGDQNEVVVQEFAELEKDSFSLLCEEKYDLSRIKGAIETGRGALISTLRTQNMYPIGYYAEKIADSVRDIMFSADKESVELTFDDMELLAKIPAKEWEIREEEIEEEPSEIDELLEEEIEDDYEKDVFDNYQSVVKVADEDVLEADEES